METSNCYQKHLNLSKRILIEQLLNEGKNFSQIADAIGKSNKTISYEIKKHRLKRYGIKFTNNTNTKCPLLEKPPYVCNPCPKKKACRRLRYFYSAENAHMDYKDNLVASRTGIDLTNDEFISMNKIIMEDIKKGHSFYMICKNHKEEFPVKSRTLYNYMERQYLDVKNIDLPRKVRYKKRSKKEITKTKNTKHRINRTYQDFKKYIANNPDMEIVEMDTVEGIKGQNEHVLLTLLWRKSKLLLAFKLKHKTSDCVTEVFEKIKQKLGMELFHRYFPIILTDNGSEFSNPYDIENNGPDVIGSKVFYCDPRASQQKGSIEVAHEYIRRFIPKGISLNNYTQNDINLIINHINNTPRKILDDKHGNNTPFYLQKTITEDIFFNTFKLYYIKPTEVILNKTIFKINKGDAK